MIQEDPINESWLRPDEAPNRTVTPSRAMSANSLPSLPFNQTTQSQPRDKAADDLRTTSETPPVTDKSPSTSKVPGSLPAISSTQPETHPKLLAAGISGADPDSPLFDGTSHDPADHLIDVDTPSMETCPDVRVYFWLVGRAAEEPPDEPDDPEERVNYDAELVRKGREYLKAVRARGGGLWLSPSRDILAENQAGKRWYRLPTVGIVESIVSAGGFDALNDEGYLFDHEMENEIDCTGVVLTNIRVPILWSDSHKPGVVPGTAGWDDSIGQCYTTMSNPAYMVTSGVEYDDLIFNFMVHSGQANTPEAACHRPEVERLMRRDWPDLKRPYFRNEHTWTNPKFTDLPNNTMDQFLMRSE